MFSMLLQSTVAPGKERAGSRIGQPDLQSSPLFEAGDEVETRHCLDPYSLYTKLCSRGALLLLSVGSVIRAATLLQKHDSQQRLLEK